MLWGSVRPVYFSWQSILRKGSEDFCVNWFCIKVMRLEIFHCWNWEKTLRFRTGIFHLSDYYNEWQQRNEEGKLTLRFGKEYGPALCITSFKNPIPCMPRTKRKVSVCSIDLLKIPESRLDYQYKESDYIKEEKATRETTTSIYVRFV